jgi:hypothetical protein
MAQKKEKRERNMLVYLYFLIAHNLRNLHHFSTKLINLGQYFAIVL